MTRLCAGASPFDIAISATEWFEQMEALALSCLREGFDFATFDARLAAVPVPSAGAKTAASADAPYPEIYRTAEFGGLLSRLLERAAVGYSLWWTSESQTSAARFYAYQGLPPMAEFARFLG